jgi:hypothetical protein
VGGQQGVERMGGGLTRGGRSGVGAGWG